MGQMNWQNRTEAKQEVKKMGNVLVCVFVLFFLTNVFFFAHWVKEGDKELMHCHLAFSRLYG